MALTSKIIAISFLGGIGVIVAVAWNASIPHRHGWFPALKEPAHIRLGYFGCKYASDYNKMRELSDGDDTAALTRFIADRSRNCQTFSDNAVVSVEDLGSAPEEAVCIRPQGDYDCYWYKTTFLKQ